MMLGLYDVDLPKKTVALSASYGDNSVTFCNFLLTFHFTKIVGILELLPVRYVCFCPFNLLTY